jgi:hypothetical protein
MEFFTAGFVTSVVMGAGFNEIFQGFTAEVMQ